MNELTSIWFWDYHFEDSKWLWLLVVIPIFIFFKHWSYIRKQGAVKTPRLANDLNAIAFRPGKYIIYLLYGLYSMAIISFILACSKPVYLNQPQFEQEYDEGIDIILCMDVSGSMMATDFMPNRLEAAKDVAIDFIEGRPSDRIGLVVFEGEAYTACPATRHHAFLKKTIKEVESGWLESGTAIGTGLGTAVTRLRSDSLNSKVVILLTDGESNQGDITPLAAAELAQNKNVRVYTIGVGKDGYVSMPVQTVFGPIYQNTMVTLNEKELKEIAAMTGGEYFRATDNSSLKEIYEKIEDMEKTKMVESTHDKPVPLSPLSFLLFGIITLLFATLTDFYMFRGEDA